MRPSFEVSICQWFVFASPARIFSAKLGWSPVRLMTECSLRWDLVFAFHASRVVTFQVKPGFYRP
jgi:hypothetical protein